MMKKTSSKILAAILTAAMTFSMVGCGTGSESKTSESVAASTSSSETTASEIVEEKLYYNKTGYPICDEPITITMSGTSNTTDWDNTAMHKYFEKKLGIKTDSTELAADALKTQYALMIAERSMPDMMVKSEAISKEQVNMDGEAGYWLDLSQYLDLMPNLVAFWEEHPEVKAYNMTDSGAIYSINRITLGEGTNISGMLYYNKALVEAVYPDPIETVDDLYEALVAVKEAYPDKIPLSLAFNSANSSRGDVIIRTAFGVESRALNYCLYKDDNNELVLGETTEGYRAYLNFMNKLYDEKLLDEECFTYTEAEYRAKEDAGEFVFWADSGLRNNVSAISDDPRDFVMIPALTSEYQEESTFLLNHGIGTGARLFVSADTKYPEAICRLIDFLYTEEGWMLTSFGVEGEHFEYVTDKYGNVTIDSTRLADLQNYSSVGNWRQQAVVNYQAMCMNWALDNVWTDKLSIENAKLMLEDPDVNAVNKGNAMRTIVMDSVEVVKAIPIPVSYTLDETETRATLYTDISNYIISNKASVISGSVDFNDDKAWNAYLDTLNKMGLEKLMKIEKDAWTRMEERSK